MRFRNACPFIVLAILALVALPAAAASVDPIVVDGNPTCEGQGFSFGFKPQPEPPPTGVYTFPDGVNTFTITSDGTYFSFTSTLAVDAIIVKGGSNANVYLYPTEVTADSGLNAPENASGGFAAISHIEVCYDYEVTVAKTAVPTYTRTIGWTIVKTVAPETISMFTGDSATAEYTVTVDKTVVDSNFAVSGTITVTNPSPFTAEGISVEDVLSDGTNAAVTCPATSLAPGGSMVCTYTASLAGATDLVNTATVTTTGIVGGGAANADVDFGLPTTVVGYDTINVTDDKYGALGSAGDDKTFLYEQTFACDGDAGENGNTATIVETGANDSASVMVSCYAITVKKTAETELDRTWSWTIAKTAATPDLTLSTGQVFGVTYEVALGATSADSNFAAHGTINVENPAPIPAKLAGVADLLLGGSAVVECGVTFPYILAAGGFLPCTWTADLPDAEARINTASATLQNTPSGTTSFSGTALVEFGAALVHTVDGCVSLSDTYDAAGLPSSACIADGLKQTFSYVRPVGPYGDCGTYTVTNIASLDTADTKAHREDDALVTVKVVGCEDLGCTLTPGYWKTHSSYGPAPYDDTWARIGEDTPFYLSGQSYYQVLWTAPAGNAYYILAHAFIATQLNGLNDAFVPGDVQAAWDGAAEIFSDYAPAAIAALKAKYATQLRAEILGYAYILDQYNNGLAADGPPHCSE